MADPPPVPPAPPPSRPTKRLFSAMSPPPTSPHPRRSSKKSNSAASTSSTTTTSSNRKRDLLSLRDGGRRCLSCRDGDPLVVHVLPKADDLRFEEYARVGLLAFDSLDHIDNRILLCSNCHKQFDANSTPPGWILLPSDLDYFIAWEREHGGARLPPQGYTGTYSIYSFIQHSRNIADALNDAGGIRDWGGSPVAAVLKAAAGVSQVPVGTARGVPVGVRERYALLTALWRLRWERGEAGKQEEEGGVDGVSEEEEEGGSTTEEEGSGGAEGGLGGQGTGGADTRGQRTSEPAQTQTQIQTHSPPRSTCDGHRSKKQRVERKGWLMGPNMSACDIMRRVNHRQGAF